MTLILLRYSTFKFCPMGHSTESACALYSRPLRIICLSAVGHSDGSGSTLRATAQNFLKSYGLQHRISFDSDTNHIPCVFIGLVSMHPWPCIHMIIYLHDHISTCTWLCIIQMKNFVLHYGS